VYEVNAHSLHTPADQHKWHCNIYFLLWFCIHPEDGLCSSNMLLMINYKAVYRLDLYLFYLPVYLKTIGMPCLKKMWKKLSA